jgi:hypothetical protein
MLNNILNGWRPLITKLAIFGFLLYVLVKCIPALAASVTVDSKWTCGTSKEVGEALMDNGEQIIATGAVDDMFIMSFWANKETREWTLVLTDNKDRDISCVVAYGDKLRTISTAKTSV